MARRFRVVSKSGTLWRIDPDRRVTAMVRDIYVSNTVCWSPDDRTMYFGDTMAGWIYAFDFDLAAGTLSRRREFALHPRGLPDGSAVDAEGFLWNCRWGGGCVIRFDPDWRGRSRDGAAGRQRHQLRLRRAPISRPSTSPRRAPA